ncbi:uncharacterized protein LOC105689174 [Athalia rosae]|uniref:uncharacterized protein LOC105689174 n=1 Tax=Athalia rosae TaxID=37344 RepID=UPI00203349BB|nr:uncharacterized protein LOC105689174 [Athalia rosae]
MRKLFSLVLIFVALAHDVKLVGVNGSLVNGIIDQLSEGLRNLLSSVLKDVGGLLTGLTLGVDNLSTNVLGTVSDLVDNLISMVDGLLGEILTANGRGLDECENLLGDLELVKEKTSEAVDECRVTLDERTAVISGKLNAEEDRGNDVISRVTQSLQNCLKGLSVTSCISKVQRSAAKEIQGVVKNVQSLSQRISATSDEVTKCLNFAEENGRESANEIYQKIQLCVAKSTTE